MGTRSFRLRLRGRRNSGNRLATAAPALFWCAQVAACGPDPRDGLVTGIVSDGGAVTSVGYGGAPGADAAASGQAEAATSLAGKSHEDGSAAAAAGWQSKAGGGATADAHSSGQKCPPVAVVGVKEGEQVVPQTVLHLSGASSFSPCGLQLAGFEWTVKQPGCMNQQLQPSAQVTAPTLLANAPGEYQFCLQVTDTAGTASAPACRNVWVIPDAKLEVALAWCLPAGKGGGGKVDLDVHLAVPVQLSDVCGSFVAGFESPNSDCFYWNKTPQWGDPASAADNAVLALDDTAGPGPELIDVAAPPGTQSLPKLYAVGVKYWSAAQKPDVQATVEVFVDGAMVGKVTNPALHWHEAWFVGMVWYPDSPLPDNPSPLHVCHPLVPKYPWVVGPVKCVIGNAYPTFAPSGAWCIADQLGEFKWKAD